MVPATRGIMADEPSPSAAARPAWKLPVTLSTEVVDNSVGKRPYNRGKHSLCAPAIGLLKN
jgi:hypothetical protein